MSVLIVSDEDLKGDVGKFVAKHGYAHYYGPITRGEVSKNLLDRLPGVDIFWMEATNLAEEVSLEESHHDPKSGRKMVIVRHPLGIEVLSDDIILHEMFPMIDIETLKTLSLHSERMSKLYARRMYNMALELGEITPEEFRRLGTSKTGVDLNMAYILWYRYNRIISAAEKVAKLQKDKHDDPGFSVWDNEDMISLNGDFRVFGEYIERFTPARLRKLFNIAVIASELIGEECSLPLILITAVRGLISHLSNEDIISIWMEATSGITSQRHPLPKDAKVVDLETWGLVNDFLESKINRRDALFTAIVLSGHPVLSEIPHNDELVQAIGSLLTSVYRDKLSPQDRNYLLSLMRK